jgi:glycosyltransferase involved in cell wall biosynthesis
MIRPVELRARLDNSLPATLPASRSTALFLYGYAFHPERQVADLALLVDGVAHPPAAARMPRPDVHAWLGGLSRFSGFWGTVPVPGRAGGTIDIAVRARLDSGETVEATLGTIPVAPPAPPPPEPTGTIAVCLATFEPAEELLAVQLESLRAQTDPDWTCVISDGGSSPEALARIEAAISGDARFALHRSDARLDPYRNFERALTLAPPHAGLVALCDQDDRWYPDKLAALRGALDGHVLVHSDVRLVDSGGRVIADSLWHGRRRDEGNLASLLVANAVPGAAMLFRRELLGVALPFPEAPGVKYHDHWLALAARAVGSIGYVERPLYDYVQHAAAVQGRVAAGARARRSSGRGAYFGGYVPREVYAQTLLARGGEERALRWFVAADRSCAALVWLALRPLRRFIGRDETLSGEVALVLGLLWRRFARIARRDCSVPEALGFEQRRLRRWRSRT